jgi:exo-beta-1,3-glucanase (GH17 family)
VAFWWWLGREQPVPGGLADGERLQCVSYTPFRADETPVDFTVDRTRLAEDFALLAPRVGCLRLYSVRDMELVPAVAREHGLTLIMGAWISGDEPNNELEVDGLIRLANQYPDVIQAVLVGNEVLLRRERTAAQLQRYLQQVQAAVKQPVSYGDVWEFWLRNPVLAVDADFITIHLLPYWEDEPTGIDEAIAAVAAARAKVVQAFPGKDILVGEAGWPSEGRQRERAVPSRVNQARFVRGFIALADAEGWRYNLIEAFDQPWKRAQEGAVGGYWGLFDAQRRDKGALQGDVSNLAAWRYWLAGALLAWGLLLAWGRGWRRAPAIILAALCANSLAMHGLELLLFSRNPAETAWFLLLGAAAVAAYLVGCQRLAGHPRSRWHDAVVGIGAGLAAVVTLGLVFDPRYRYFPVAPFMVLAVVAWAGCPPDGPWRNRNRVLGWLLAACLPAVLWHETLLNGQALAWAAVTGVLALGLLRGGGQAGARAVGRAEGDSTNASSASTAAGAP